MFTKPCERSDRGCTRLVSRPGPKTLAKRRFCSRDCSTTARMESGTWRPHVVPMAAKSWGGRIGGRASGEMRRAKAMRTAARAALRIVPQQFREQLTPEQLALVSTLVARAWLAGRKVGYQVGHHKNRCEQAQKGTATAA